MERYFSATAFTAYFIKMMVLPSSYVDVCVLAVLTSLLVFYHFYFQIKLATDLRKQLSDLKLQIETQAVEIKDIRNYASGIKLGQQRLGR